MKPLPSVHILLREALYERVWQTPLSGLAEEFGTNSSWLKKLCQQAAIPLPERGHWSKLRAGKPVVHTALPPRPPGASAIVTIGHYWGWERSRREMLSDPIPIKPEFTQTIESMVSHALQKLGTGHGDAKAIPPMGVLDASRWAFQHMLGARLREVGATLHIPAIDPALMVARCGATEVSSRITRSSDRHHIDLYADRHCNRRYQAFVDHDHRQLEDQLPEIVSAILTVAETQYREEAIRHYEWCIERRANAERDVRQRSIKAKKLLEKRRNDRADRHRQLLFSQAEDWRMAQDIRGFVADVLQKAGGAATHQPWADWALRQADLIDPVKQDALKTPHQLPWNNYATPSRRAVS